MKQLAVFAAAAALSVAAPVASAYAETAGPINVVGVENEYADVVSQIGGKFVKVVAIETDPNTDPHTLRGEPERRQADRSGWADRRERSGLR